MLTLPEKPGSWGEGWFYILISNGLRAPLRVLLISQHFRPTVQEGTEQPVVVLERKVRRWRPCRSAVTWTKEREKIPRMWADAESICHRCCVCVSLRYKNKQEVTKHVLKFLMYPHKGVSIYRASTMPEKLG